MNELRIRGRVLLPQHLDVIREIAGRGGQTRRAISVEVCARFGWQQPNGRPWDMACRDLLLRLHRMGLVVLPEPKMRTGKRRPIVLTNTAEPQAAIETPVGQLGPLQWEQVDGTPLARLWNEYIHRYHYLGLKTLVGPKLRYLIGFNGGWLAAMGFSGAAWKLKPRDAWIGWSLAQREARLGWIVNQARYLILPWVRSKNLASHLLAHAARLLPRDWEAKYSRRPLLLETFVDGRRYPGTCYYAANWTYLGHSQGRGKMDCDRTEHLPLKDIFVYPLHRAARELLRAP